MKFLSTEETKGMMLALCCIPISVTGKQPLYIRLYIHSSTGEMKANASSDQAQQAAPTPFVPICPPTSPPLSPSLYLAMRLWNSNSATDFHIHKLLKSRLKT